MVEATKGQYLTSKSLQIENFGLKIDLLWLSFCAISHKLDTGNFFWFVYIRKFSENHGESLHSWIFDESIRVELVDSAALLSPGVNSARIFRV